MKDEHVRYPAREMVRLLGDKERIRDLNYSHTNQDLDYVEVKIDCRLFIIFILGIWVRCILYNILFANFHCIVY